MALPRSFQNNYTSIWEVPFQYGNNMGRTEIPQAVNKPMFVCTQCAYNDSCQSLESRGLPFNSTPINGCASFIKVEVVIKKPVQILSRYDILLGKGDLNPP
jgi:hypothetical protein